MLIDPGINKLLEKVLQELSLKNRDYKDLFFEVRWRENRWRREKKKKLLETLVEILCYSFWFFVEKNVFE